MIKDKLFGLPAQQGRWVFVGLGFLANLCMGSVYAYSVFRKPLENLWGITATQSGLPFMIFLAVFALGMAFAGSLVENWGPRKTGILGGILVGVGWIAAGFSPNIGVLSVLYGVVAGAGVGIAYGCPIAVAGRWFPDRRGLAVGLTLAGFGASALIMAPILNASISAYGPLRTFQIFGIVFLIVMVLVAIPMRYPSASFPAEKKGARSGTPTKALDLDRIQMLRTSSFWALWSAYVIGCLSGLMAIGIASPFGQEVAKLSAGLSAAAVSVFAVFNGIGRPLFGWLTDRISPRNAALLSFGLILGSALLLYFGGSQAPLYFLGFCILWLNLGGWLAIAPTATAFFFGMKHYGKNYGIVFTAYGVGAILGNILSGFVRDLTGSYVSVFPWVMALAVVGLAIAFLGLRPPVSTRVKG